MGRFEVYFLQKKVAGVWDTLERAQSVSVLVTSLVREFDARDDAELRILAGAYDQGSGSWEYTQIFFVDRGAIELGLIEAEVDESADSLAGDAWATDEAAADDAAADDAPDESVPGGREFADAIRRASDENRPVESRAADPIATDDDDTWVRRRSRPLFEDDPLDTDAPVGPPPGFRPQRQRGGRVFFVVGTLLIALVLTGAALLAPGIALDAPQVRPLLSWVRGLSDGSRIAVSGPAAVMPETTGQVITYAGVAEPLRGRWSPGRCDETYIEFDADGLVVGAPNRPESLKVPVVETIEDEFTWFVRRSPDLVEHFQKLGPNDLQLIGDTTRIGFSARTSDILTRCP